MEGFSPKMTFLDIVRGSYYSSVGEIDFAESEMAANGMNTWVEEQTMQKIKNLIDPSTIGSDTRLVLVIAIYFKAYWEFTFDEELTHEKTFYAEDLILGSQNVSVQMMVQENYFEVYMLLENAMLHTLDAHIVCHLRP